MYATLPTIAVTIAAPLDSLRRMLRADPALRALGRVLGPTRYFSQVEADQIRAAWEARRAKHLTRVGTPPSDGF